MNDVSGISKAGNMLNNPQWLSVARSTIIYASGIASAVGVVGHFSPAEVITGFDHIVKGLNEIVIGVGIVAPTIMTIWGVFSKSPVAMVTDAGAVPGVKVIVGVLASTAVKAVAADPAAPNVVATVPAAAKPLSVEARVAMGMPPPNPAAGTQGKP